MNCDALKVERDKAHQYSRELQHEVDVLGDENAYFALQIQAGEATRAALREALAEAGVVLEALNASVAWELAPSVKAEISRVVVEIRKALAASAPERTT